MRNALCAALLACSSAAAQAGSPLVYEKSAHQDLDAVYVSVNKELEDKGFHVVYEIDIGKNLAGFAGAWGRDYNRNGLDGIKSMVICSARYANEISNADPFMLALCPLHVTLIHKAEITTVLFVRPGAIARGSAAEKAAGEIERGVIAAIESGLGD